MATATALNFETHDVIFHKGDEGHHGYIITSGKVEIFLEENGIITPITTLKVGEFLGEMSIIDGQRRSASARALQPTQLTIITKNQVQERLKQSDPLVKHLMSLLVQRLRIQNKSPHENEPQTAESQKMVEKMQFEADLNKALENHELHLQYQPIVNLENLNTVGFEALVRWNSPTRGPVRPDIFMGLAEETSLVLPIGNWIIHQAIQDLAALKKQWPDVPNLYMSINISGRQFEDGQMIEVLESSAQEYGVNRSSIYLEITERVLMNGLTAVQTLEKLHQLGYRILLDDFGTGFSSLSYLTDLPLHILKIDQSFVKRILKEPKSLSLCRSIATIANDLQLGTVAEGLETREHVNAIKQLGATHGQGYYFAKPMLYKDISEKTKKFSL